LTADTLRKDWEECPSGELMLKCLREIPEADIEPMCNRILLEQYHDLPAQVRDEFKRSGLLIVDFHKEPYWGDPAKVAVMKGKNEHDSWYHFIYLTVDLCSEHYRFTIYMTSRVEGFPIETYLQPALDQVLKVITPRYVLFDGEFPTVQVVIFFEGKNIRHLGRKSQTKAVKMEIFGYRLDPSQIPRRRWHVVTITDSKTGDQISIHVTVQEVNGRLKVLTKSIWDDITPDDAERLYKMRFSIDNGYRNKHTFMAVTSSRSWAVRMVLFLVSVLLWNVWRLAIVWNTLFGIPPIPVENIPELTRKQAAFHLFEYLLYEGWKL
jgi:hypothetical protein